MVCLTWPANPFLNTQPFKAVAKSYEEKDIILHVENLSVVYDGKTIINNVNFVERDTVRPGLSQDKPSPFWAVQAVANQPCSEP